jgi:transposase
VGEISTIGLDLAKNVFQVHGVDGKGAVVIRKRLRRGQVLKFFSGLPRCVVAMEACASSHYWGREIGRLGHEVRLIAPAHVKPFVKRQKNDATDAEAICEAAQRPSMRFVEVKSEERQACAVVFRARDLLVRQRTQTINALRGHLGEFGVVVAQGALHVGKLARAIEDDPNLLPAAARAALGALVQTLCQLEERISELDREIGSRLKEDETARRLMTIPGIGRIAATAMVAIAPDAKSFAKGRDFAAWLGLTPRQHSTGGKQRLGRTSKMGERSLRRLLIIGASAVLRWAVRRKERAGQWLKRIMATKPPLVARVALANKMARIVWALMANGGTYRAPVAVA